MRQINLLFLILIFCIGVSCNSDIQEPIVDLSSYSLEDTDLELSVVASEPLIEAPVWIDFDDENRIWVAEMRDFMPDINGDGESIPKGRISILEDRDGDGRMDIRYTFLDNLPMIRTIRLFGNGLLYADHQKLWFVEINKNRPGKKLLIDSLYAPEGNVEHKPNGLLFNLDNCFYNAKSHFKYCYKDGNWSKQPTAFRGQWGISRDDFGRLYVNDNSNILFGDHFLPGFITNNKYQHNPRGVTENLVTSRRVYPAHSTSVNRGYIEGYLDSLGRLLNVTSACGPLIFPGTGWHKKYNENGFICVPEANLIKRVKLNIRPFFKENVKNQDTTEFLTSTDEAFRPVNLEIGPQGALYIVDMHKGIIQHGTYMTRYLRKEIHSKQLDTINSFGRILKVAPKNTLSENLPLIPTPAGLAILLSSPEIQTRYYAHEKFLVLPGEAVEKVFNEDWESFSAIGKIHALWIKDYHKILDKADILQSIQSSNRWLAAHALGLLNKNKNQFEKEEIINIFKEVSSSNDAILIHHLLCVMPMLYENDPETFKITLNNILDSPIDSIIPDAFITAFPETIKIPGEFIQHPRLAGDKNMISILENYHRRQVENEVYHIFEEDTPDLIKESGRSIYRTYCGTCHGNDGRGLKNLAPALVDAKLINDHPLTIAYILERGLEGQVTIGGEKVSFPTVMPSFTDSDQLNAEEIRAVSNYIYNAFRNEVVYLSQKEIEEGLEKISELTEVWTEESLLKFLNKE